MLSKEEYIEQQYFFRALRERLADQIPAQEILSRLHEEILSTTRLPLAIEFLAQELKFRGVLHRGMARLEHYFTPFQIFVVAQAEDDKARVDLDTALLLLERQAAYLAKEPTPAGLFAYQFESTSRNRLGYDQGLLAVSRDPIYDEPWREWILRVRSMIGTVDFADLLYARSEYYLQEQRRRHSQEKQPRHPVLFGEKEGKIAKANRGKDPLYLFSALQRQLGYPEVPRPKTIDDEANLLRDLQQRLRQMEKRVQLLESELKGEMDLSRYYAKPEQERQK